MAPCTFGAWEVDAQTTAVSAILLGSEDGLRPMRMHLRCLRNRLDIEGESFGSAERLQRRVPLAH